MKERNPTTVERIKSVNDFSFTVGGLYHSGVWHGKFVRDERDYIGVTFLDDKKAKTLVEKTPLVLSGNKEKHVKIFDTILRLAKLDGWYFQAKKNNIA
jgi:hypothetical protein